MAMAVFRLPQTSGVGRCCSQKCPGKAVSASTFTARRAEALTALVRKLSVFFDSRACIEHSRMAMSGGVQQHTSYGRFARWFSRSTPRIQSFGKPIAAAQNSSLTMPSMRFAWLGSRLLGKNSFVDMSRLAASVRDLCDMVGNGIEHVLVRGVGKQSLLNGLVSNGRDP